MTSRRGLRRTFLVLAGAGAALLATELGARLWLGAQAAEQAADLAHGAEQARQLLTRTPG